MQPTKSKSDAGYGSLSATSNENPFQAAAKSRAANKTSSDGWDADGWGNADGWGDSKDNWGSNNDGWGNNDSWNNDWGNESKDTKRSSATRNNGNW